MEGPLAAHARREGLVDLVPRMQQPGRCILPFAGGPSLSEFAALTAMKAAGAA